MNIISQRTVSFFKSGRIFLMTLILTVVPVYAQQAAVAKVIRMRDEVLLKRQNDADFTRAVTPQMDLLDRDALRTGETGFVSIIFADDQCLVKIKSNSQFAINESPNTRGLILDYGSIRSTLPQPIKEFRVETPVSVASVKGTDYWVVHDAVAGADRIYGLDGVVDVLNKVSQATQTLTANTMIMSFADGTITQPIPFLPNELPVDPEETEGVEPQPDQGGEEEGATEETGDAGTTGDQPEVPMEDIMVSAQPPAPADITTEGEPAPDEEEQAPEPKSGPGFGLGLGSVTLDDQVYYQIALRPEINLGKFGIGLDIVGYMDGQGNFRKDEWDEPSDYLDKIFYLRYGQPQDPFFMRIGAMPVVQYGFGGLMNNYSNITEYPQVRRVGFEMGGKISDKATLKGFVADMKEFKTGAGLLGVRGTYKPLGKFPLVLGVNVMADMNQYGGLKDKDGDNRPDLVDDFPDDKLYWLDSDGDQLADGDPLEFDIDGDGITDTLDARIPGYTGPVIFLDDSIVAKSEPFNLATNKSKIIGVSADISFPLLTRNSFNLVAYTEGSLLKYQDTLWAIRADTLLVKRHIGLGLVGPGIQANILKFLTLKFEYRYSSSLYQPGFFNTTYDFERAGFLKTRTKAGADSVYVQTKDRASLTNPYAMRGFFGSASASLFNLVRFEAGYQKMAPVNADTSAYESNSFIAILDFNTDPIPKISEARAYYIRNNDPNPFDFANPTANTTIGYKLGYELAPGVSLVYNMQESYRDLDGSGTIDQDNERIRIISIETAFNF